MVRLYSENGRYNGHLNGDGYGNGHPKEKIPAWWAPRGKVEHSDRELQARAFNLGCDARINGRSFYKNPYPHDGHLTTYWKKGWQDVDQHWGEWAKGSVPPLPEVDA